MRKAVLLYNPVSGRRQATRDSDLEGAASVLRAAGVDVSISETLGADRTALQVSQQIADGCDTIIACGGDGTIHDILQGIVGTNVALGVIPLGTANSLAKDLRLPTSPQAAARALLGARLRQIAAGRISCRGASGEPISRYFTVTAGIGADAEVFYNLTTGHKRRLGHAAYYVEASKLWLTHPFPLFSVRFKTTATSQWQQAEVGQLLAVRIADFGGLLRNLAPGASLDRNDLRLVLFRTRRRWAYLSYALRAALAGKWLVPDVDLSFAHSVACEPLAGNWSAIFVEADGEPLGMLPAEISIIPDALTILMP
jgi:YegS/Rv2252/BmrU family lipid kinase